VDWTVPDLAEATALHRNTINNIEVGHYTEDPKTLELIEKR
jgi:DNA-binding XRE family transcriptional regulator